jgi:hypothetical protein
MHSIRSWNRGREFPAAGKPFLHTPFASTSGGGPKTCSAAQHALLLGFYLCWRAPWTFCQETWMASRNLGPASFLPCPHDWFFLWETRGS